MNQGAEGTVSHDFELFKLDYAETHAAIRRFDTLLFHIRSWAVSAAATLVALAITVDEPAVFFVTPLPVLVFWALDTMYQSYQRVCIADIRSLEELVHRSSSDAMATVRTTFGFNSLLRGPRMADLLILMFRMKATLVLYGTLIVLTPIAAALLRLLSE